MRATFAKAEKLCSKKSLQELMDNGRSLSITPFKLIWQNQKLDTDYPAQLVIAVPKRSFKKAVDRNRIKRQIREAYRLNKEDLYRILKEKEKQCAIMLIYTGKETPIYKDLEIKIKTLLLRLIKEHE